MTRGRFPGGRASSPGKSAPLLLREPTPFAPGLPDIVARFPQPEATPAELPGREARPTGACVVRMDLDTPPTMFRGVFRRIPGWIGAVAWVVVVVAGTSSAVETGGPEPGPLSGVNPVEIPGIHNAFRIGSRYYSGSAPDSEEAFFALARAGVKTIITVDGTQPDVETARRHGIRYIHLPHGYDGVSTNVEIQIQKAIATISGPIFFHCHHGKHRGPAAAAIACIATEGWTPEKADRWLHLAGTDTNYAGLYRTVEQFHPLTPEALAAISAVLPERAGVSRLIDAMVGIDASWDALKAARKVDYVAPADQPDLDPANEATLLMEHFREAARLEEVKRKGAAFLEAAGAMERLGSEAAVLLRQRKDGLSPELNVRLDRVFDGINRSCASCHHDFRN
jgi:protein tyrosine phosphatase (PTP) superfamily phosphohydrolase (DUF442 family)